MNSPSSSDTTVQPWRMWRLSESDLYCVAMKMWRSPELMQLLRTKSMMRYGPPKYTAGLARSRVERRQPFARATGQHDYEDVVTKHGGIALAKHITGCNRFSR